MGKTEDEGISLYTFIGAIVAITVIFFISFRIYQIGDETSRADNTCKVLDLGNYHIGSQNDITQKDINGQKYFKCTKDIYNSTSLSGRTS